MVDYSLIWLVVPIVAGSVGISFQNVPIQNRIFGNIFFIDVLKGLVGNYDEGVMFLTWAMLGIWLLRDNFGGRFVGKAIMGLRVFGSPTGQEMTAWQGVKRNVVLFLPFAMLIAAAQISRGQRIGEKWARIWVLLDSKQEVFITTSIVDGSWVSQASKRECEGNWDEARNVYKQVIQKHPGTKDAREAEQCLAVLEKTIQSSEDKIS